jgi:hypothetical protein
VTGDDDLSLITTAIRAAAAQGRTQEDER